MARLEEIKEELRKVTAQKTATSEQLRDVESRLINALGEDIERQLSDFGKKLDTVN